MNGLGEIYALRKDEGQDHERALAWWSNAIGQCSVGYYYLKGLGRLKKDYARAMQHFRNLAENGCLEACSNMVELYHYGLGVRVDYNQLCVCMNKQMVLVQH